MARDVHCDIMGHNLAKGTYHDVTIHILVLLGSSFIMYYYQVKIYFFLSKIFKIIH